MYNVRVICEDTWWLGASDRRIQLFENTYPVPNGMSYNNYLIMDEKTCLLDGVDEAVSRQFEENLAHVLDGRPLDYLVIDHMEPDHCAVIPDLVRRWPNLKLVGTPKAFDLVRQFHGFDPTPHAIKVKEGDHVEANDLLLMLEAMKMENEIFSPATGTVVGVHVKKGDAVNSDDLLISIG